MIYSITCFFLRIACRILFKCKIYGVENIPRKGSFIVAPNHVSHLDPIAVGVFVRRKYIYLAKKELFKNRFWGWYLRKLRIIPIDREKSPYSGMKETIRKIKNGDPLVIFPEGTRSDGKSFLEPETGAAYLALKFNLPVVPVYVKGTEKALPKGAHFIQLTPIKVYYGKPKRYQMPAEGDRYEAYKKVSRSIMEEIRELKNRYG